MDNIYIIVSGEDWEGMDVVGVHRTLDGAMDAVAGLLHVGRHDGYVYMRQDDPDCAAEWRDGASYIRIEARVLGA